MLQTPALVFCAVDAILPIRGKISAGFAEFSASLEHAAIPLIWVTKRTRLQIDEPRRRLGHGHPFIAEGGSGAYLPEGYFNVRPAETVRLGRFTCIPVAEQQPAAAEALEDLAVQTGVTAVPLRSLAPRELAQNSGLPTQQAELMRQRDFDELFFFAGASEKDIERFAETAREKRARLRKDAAFWSLAIGANLKRCVRELARFYGRALRYQPKILGIAADEEADLLDACDRGFLLRTKWENRPGTAKTDSRFREADMKAPECWERILEAVMAKS